MLFCLSWCLVPVRACLDLGQNCSQNQLVSNPIIQEIANPPPRSLTPQSVNSPLLKLLQRDLCSRWFSIEIQPVRIVLLLEYRRSKLLLLMVQSRPPLRVDSVEILANHPEVLSLSILTSLLLLSSLSWTVCRLLPLTSTHSRVPPPMPRTRNAPIDTRPRDHPRDFPNPTESARLHRVQRAYGNYRCGESRKLSNKPYVNLQYIRPTQ